MASMNGSTLACAAAPRAAVRRRRAARGPLWLQIALSAALVLAVGLAAFRVTLWSAGGSLVWSDGVAYFLTARSLVIDGNSDIGNEIADLEARPAGTSLAGTQLLDSLRTNMRRDASGRAYTPWPVGAGALMTPFYAAGWAAERLVAEREGRMPDSYGLLPQYFFGIGSLAWGLIGFWAAFFACRRIVPAGPASIGALGAVLAGPAVFYMFGHPSMAHALSFGLAGLATLSWLRQWQEGAGVVRFALLCLLVGLLAAVRLQSLLFALLPASLLLRAAWRSGFFAALRLALAGALTGAAGLAMQIAHARLYGPPQTGITLTGAVVMIGTYPFHLGSPYFLDVLLSCRHGAFHWAPILGIASLGLAVAAWREGWARVLLLAVLAQVWLIGALGIASFDRVVPDFSGDWNTHWQGGTSFGMRYLTECTPMFALGLAWLASRGWPRRARLWQAGTLALAGWNGLLMLAYGLGTVSRSYCVTYPQMLQGVSEALGRLLERLA